MACPPQGLSPARTQPPPLDWVGAIEVIERLEPTIGLEPYGLSITK
jgi:hypothetical protein